MINKRIWAIGDIHGSYLPIENFLKRNENNMNFSPETDIIILLGDVGANFFLNYRDLNFKKKLNKYPFTYFCIRGNHEQRASICSNENSDQWHKEIMFENTVLVENKYPNIKYALDEVTFYKINNFETLVIPGAYSVDKYYRLAKGWSWFREEQLTEEERNIGLEYIKKHNFKTDLVLSHTCPISYVPTDLFLSQIDQSLVDKTMERYLGQIEYQLDYKLWLWGHFHNFRIYPYYNNRQCIMLSAGQEVINVLDCLNNPKEIQKKW